jgi:hypothetical protein
VSLSYLRIYHPLSTGLLEAELYFVALVTLRAGEIGTEERESGGFRSHREGNNGVPGGACTPGLCGLLRKWPFPTHPLGPELSGVSGDSEGSEGASCGASNCGGMRSKAAASNRLHHSRYWT